MLTCPNPTCKANMPGLEKTCPRCKADLSLLVSYVETLQDGLYRAEAMTRDGQLGEAVWAYLEVLEVDPDNAAARRQVGKVATAIRRFDDTAPGRRWLKQIHKQHRFRRWMAGTPDGAGGSRIIWTGLAWLLLVVAVFLLGFGFGIYQGRATAPPPMPNASEAG